MNRLPLPVLEHETLQLAVLVIARKVAAALNVGLDEPLAESCRRIGANRTSVYEQVQRIWLQLEQLASAAPGRPPRAPEASAEHDVATLRLTIEILEHCLEHPGSRVGTGRRVLYASGLRRLILSKLDAWQGSLEAFAAAVRVPLDTLRDWLQRDRKEALPEVAPTPVPVVPRDASETTRAIAELWQTWVGPTRSFLTHAARTLALSTGQVLRVLRILGLVSPRRRKPPRYRGSTQLLSPGAMLVTDGKQLDVELTGSERRTSRTWQAIVDQATGCDTAIVTTDEEDADAVRRAFDSSLRFLGGSVPMALLHDNKPCYDEASLQHHVHEAGTVMLPATPARAENKAIIEGAFGLFEQRVGTIRLDDTNRRSLIDSAVHEVIRAYTAATNAVPRHELDGKSREQVLRESCPSLEQQERDRSFLRKLRARHDSRARPAHADAGSARLLDDIFQRLGITGNDPKGALRRYLSCCEPAAIRRAAAIVSAKLERGALDRTFLHRYLAKVVLNQQHELDLERAARELDYLCRRQAESWNSEEQRCYQQLLAAGLEPEQLLRSVAEHAAFGGVPLEAEFWTQRLLDLLHEATHLIACVKSHLVRLYEADPQRRLVLIDRVTAQAHALA